MHKTMIAPVCLGILLLGIVITPSVFAGDGCGTGTVLVDGVCQLAPVESSEGCGAGTVMVNGVCQLTDEDFNPSGNILAEAIAGLLIFFILAVIAIIVIIIIIAVLIKRRKTTTKPARQDLDDYESKYLSRQKIEPRRKPAEKKETSMFCDNCGVAFKKSEAKFCGECGTPRS